MIFYGKFQLYNSPLRCLFEANNELKIDLPGYNSYTLVIVGNESKSSQIHLNHVYYECFVQDEYITFHELLFHSYSFTINSDLTFYLHFKTWDCH